MTDWKERALAAEQRYVELDRTSERELAACEKERDQWYAAFVNAGKLGEAAEKELDEARETIRTTSQMLVAALKERDELRAT